MFVNLVTVTYSIPPSRVRAASESVLECSIDELTLDPRFDRSTGLTLRRIAMTERAVNG